MTLGTTATTVSFPQTFFFAPSLQLNGRTLFLRKRKEEKKNLGALCINPFEGFAGAPAPFRSPGNHGNEDQERTLSCWRPEPGFEGGNEQREEEKEEEEGGRLDQTPQFLQAERQNALGGGQREACSKESVKSTQ